MRLQLCVLAVASLHNWCVPLLSSEEVREEYRAGGILVAYAAVVAQVSQDGNVAGGRAGSTGCLLSCRSDNVLRRGQGVAEDVKIEGQETLKRQVLDEVRTDIIAKDKQNM